MTGRILFHPRTDHAVRIGGDGIVIEALRERLRRLCLSVDLSTMLDPDLETYDAVHLFNLELMPETFLQAENARRAGRPYFITPIYSPPHLATPWQAYTGIDKLAHFLLPPRVVDVLALSAACRNRLHRIEVLRNLPSLSRQRLRGRVLAGARQVFASCESERAWLLRDFPFLAPERVVVSRFGCAIPSEVAPTVPVPAAGFFLCVGALGPRKNQLTLARALRGVPGARIVFIGSTPSGNKRYRRAVEAAAPPGSLLLPEQPHGALPAFYRAARCVVQPSFIELPGLVAMEAVIRGRMVVASDRAPVREYLDGLVTFADPASCESVRRACLTSTAPNRPRAARFLEDHDWQRTATPVEDAYLVLMSRQEQAAPRSDTRAAASVG